MTRHAVPIWYSPVEILGAQQWHDEIGKALARCDWFLLLLSPRSVASKWVEYELVYALTHDRYSERIIPALVEDCQMEELSWTLTRVQRIDMRIRDETAHWQLLGSFGIAYRAP